MARYRLCGGLAIMPEHDMAMLADMSARGWHLSGFSCGILYRFEAGEPHAYDYAVDFQRDFSAEAQELYRIGGWQSVALGSSWQIVRAEAGAVPLYTDDDAQAETIGASRAGLGWAALVCALAALRVAGAALRPRQRAGVVGVPRGLRGVRRRVRVLVLPLRRLYALVAQDAQGAGGGSAPLTRGPIWDTLFRRPRKEPDMGFFDRISEGLTRSRDKFKEQMNVLLDRGPDLDEEFWDGLEETLILADVGGAAAAEIVEGLRDQATRKALPDAYAVLDLLNDQIASTFTEGGEDVLGGQPALVLFVGINGTGKTTTVGKLAKEATDAGRTVILGSADTFRAAAIEQLEVWAERANVEVVTRERGSDPASVCYDTIERAESRGADLVLIDTAGRLHTSADLMRELEKVVNVVRKRSQLPVYTVLVTDATTGQNGLSQAREFDRALDLDGVIVTKLDGTAKGGIALAVSHELGLPVLKIGVGEGLDDLRDFDAHDFARALVGEFDERA